MCIRYVWLLIVAISIAGCATAITGRNDAPDLAYTAQRPLAETANGVNTFMTQNNSLGDPFYLRIIEIDRV